jgi:hypothetical protein
MDSATTQIILSLTQQNSKLLEELALVRSELAKYQSAPIVQVAPASKAKTTKKPVDTDKPKHPSHVEAGKKVAAYNAETKRIANTERIKYAFRKWKTVLEQEEQ